MITGFQGAILLAVSNIYAIRLSNKLQQVIDFVTFVSVGNPSADKQNCAHNAD